ncbi:MAG TPA: transposase [Tepidisphaeraceae bacterium]|nr:transposase [Tepidisphaeraceae bacterium]
MPRTLGYHVVKSGYGLWLPGDHRGHWSEAWDEQIGFIEPHTLHDGDPVRLRMAQERMKHPAVRFSESMMNAISQTIDHCEDESEWSVAARAIVPTHLHLLISYTTGSIEGTVKWLSQEMTKAIHKRPPYAGPVFAKGHWIEFVFDESHWMNLIAYISRHPIKPPMVSAGNTTSIPTHE